MRGLWARIGGGDRRRHPGRGSSRLALLVLRGWVDGTGRSLARAGCRSTAGQDAIRCWSRPESASSERRPDTKQPGCPVSAVRSGERRLSGRVGADHFLHDRRGQFPRSGLALRRARLDHLSQSAQRRPRLSFTGAASQMSKARMQRCGSGSRTNPPVFSGRNTGKSLKPPPVVGLANDDGNVRDRDPAESLAPVRR